MENVSPDTIDHLGEELCVKLVHFVVFVNHMDKHHGKVDPPPLQAVQDGEDHTSMAVHEINIRASLGDDLVDDCLSTLELILINVRVVAVAFEMKESFLQRRTAPTADQVGIGAGRDVTKWVEGVPVLV